MLSPSFRAIAEPSRELARRALYRDGDGPLPSDVESALRPERGDHRDDAAAVAEHRRCDRGDAAQQIPLHARQATLADLLQAFGIAMLRLGRARELGLEKRCGQCGG